jgi:hypothetical protein
MPVTLPLVSTARCRPRLRGARLEMRSMFACAVAMDSRRRAAACLLAIVAALPGPLAGAQATIPDAALERRVGHAFLLSTGEPVYREVHEPRVADGRLMADEVTYRAPGGEVIARKRVDFSQRPLAPAFRLEDLRTGYVEGLRAGEQGRLVLFHRKGPEAERRSEAIDPPDDLVADAGFDLLIYRRIDELADGGSLTFPFAVPSRLETIRFRLRAIDRRKVLTQPAIVIRMEPASTLLRWLVDPIDVAYHARTGALLRYEGVSNIPDPDRDGNYRVRIDFPPEGVEPQPPVASGEEAPRGR